MRSFAKWMLVVGLVAVMAGPSLAQEQKGRRGQGKGGAGQRGGGMFGRGGLMLLATPAVQTEIKATDEQKEKIGELARKQGEAMRDLGQDASREDREKLRVKNADEQEKFAKDNLKPDQLKRYHQIKWQQEGVLALKDSEVQTSLKLTGDQKEKINALAEDYNKDMRELTPMGRRGGGGGGGNFQEQMQKIAALRKDFLTKGEKVLTDSQQKEWKDLLGKTFEMPAFGGGRRGGQDKDK
jgi:cell division protein ZapA (FtsZ GTPase activity inhibitor)